MFGHEAVPLEQKIVAPNIFGQRVQLEIQGFDNIHLEFIHLLISVGIIGAFAQFSDRRRDYFLRLV